MNISAQFPFPLLRNTSRWFITALVTFFLMSCGGGDTTPALADATGNADTQQPPVDTQANTDTSAVPDTAAPPAPDTATEPTPDTTIANADGWNTPCTEDDQCWGVTNYCAMQPGQTEGYCTIKCTGPPDCPALEWGCNAVFECKNIDYTWCGPASAIENGQGFVRACL